MADALAVTIDGVGKRLAQLELEEDPYEVDDENEIFETLLGSVFVVWQTYLSTMIGSVLDLDSHCRRLLNLNLSLARGGGRRRTILRFGSPPIGNTGYTGPEVIDAFSNYFKHRDEWSSDWSRLPPVSQHTADDIRACGASPNSHRNFRIGVEALGVSSPYSDFTPVKKTLSKWVSEIEPRLRFEIVSVAPHYAHRL